ncbi:MAG: 3D domain-containing protein [Candidatus Margulisbacteria bacterium]|nr:3D domain-containing protein [Candidatus Margulisiibacteriota bacterium]
MVKKLILCSVFCVLCSVFSANALTYEVVRKDSSKMMAYSSEKSQTDHDPFATAAGTRPKWGTVAANHLPLWTRLKIQGFGEKIFVVEDRHAKRHKKLVDIWFPEKKKALQFGVKRLNYWVVRNVRPLPD